MLTSALCVVDMWRTLDTYLMLPFVKTSRNRFGQRPPRAGHALFIRVYSSSLQMLEQQCL